MYEITLHAQRPRQAQCNKHPICQQIQCVTTYLLLLHPHPRVSAAMDCEFPYGCPCCAGLYGKLAPVTVANITAAVKAGSYTGSAFSRISPGEYIQLGRQGNRRLGDIDSPAGLPVNSDLAIPGPFKLSHSRPGTVALSLSENDEDPAIKDKPDYRCGCTRHSSVLASK